MGRKKHGMQMGTGGYGLSHGSSSYEHGDRGGSYGDYIVHGASFDVKAPRAPRTPKSAATSKTAVSSKITETKEEPRK